MDSYRFQELLQKLSRGTILPEEEDELHRAIEALSPDESEKLFPAANREAVHETTSPSPEEIANSYTAYKAVWQQIEKENSITPVIPIMRRLWRSDWIKAACLTGLLLLSTMLYFQWAGPDQQQAAKQAVAWTQTSTRPGEHRMLTMPDGTVVYLNGNSTIRYPSIFDDTIRQVQLVSGEIFLEVQRNEAKSFLVTTGDLQVKVLGTSFSVRNKTVEQQVSVAVKTGKVAFSKTGNNSTADYLLLTPGKKGVFEKQDGSMQQSACTTRGIGGWTRGEFEFEDATLRQILTALEDSYGFRYTITRPALAHKRFRAAFRGQTPQDMVRVLSKMGDFTYSIKDSTITIQ